MACYNFTLSNPFIWNLILSALLPIGTPPAILLVKTFTVQWLSIYWTIIFLSPTAKTRVSSEYSNFWSRAARAIKGEEWSWMWRGAKFQATKTHGSHKCSDQINSPEYLVNFKLTNVTVFCNTIYSTGVFKICAKCHVITSYCLIHLFEI